MSLLISHSTEFGSELEMRDSGRSEGFVSRLSNRVDISPLHVIILSIPFIWIVSECPD